MTAIPENDAENIAPMTPEERQAMKARLKARTIAWRHMPVFRLNDFGKRADVKLPKESRIPLSVETVRQYLLNLTLDNFAALPNWCRITKKNNASRYVILAIDEVSLADIQENPDLMPEANKLFKDGVEMSCAWSEGVGLSQALAYVPVSGQLRARLKQGLGSLSRAIKEEYIHGVVELSDKDRNTTPIEEQEKEDQEDMEIKKESTEISEKETPGKDTNGNVEPRRRTDGCSRLQLLLNPAQLVAEGYPLPGCTEPGYRFTKDVYAPVTDESRMFSIDCEWCLCIDGSSGLSRVAIVNDRLETVYHTFVKPKLPILDYLTRYSGITRQHLKNVKTTLEDVQEDIRNLLPADAILIGQSLNSDLKALKLYHPYVIDTGVIYNLTGRRSLKTKLQLLADAFMRKKIQCSTSGHNPEEDALSAMELVLLKLRMGVEYGDIILSGHSNWKVLSQKKIREILEAQESEDIAEAEEEEEESGEELEQEQEQEQQEQPKSEPRGTKRKAEETAKSKPKMRLWNENTRFFMKYCLMLHIHNVAATLITTDPTTAEVYRPSITQPNQRVVKKKLSEIEKPLVEPVNIRTVHEEQEIVSGVAESLKSATSRITIVHTSVEAIDKKNRNEQLKQIDKLISKVYSLVPLKGVFTVVLSGTKAPKENGACLVKINKPYIT